jgi:hypothetical protein
MSEAQRVLRSPIYTAIALEQPRSSSRRAWRKISLGTALALLGALASWAIVAERGDGGTDLKVVASAQAAFTEATGVQILRVATTAGGGILDLRYRVLDPDKAVVVHDKERPPQIIHEATRQIANRPFMHHSKGRDLHAAVTYYELLLNPNEVMRPGDAVTVVIGGAKLEHVIVQ